MYTSRRTLIIIPILWLGFVLAISFMEAWLKFQAEGITQAIGLSIGKLVFGVLNKIEIFFITILSISLFRKSSSLNHIHKYIVIVLLTIVFLQTFYLLPILDKRADIIIEGNQPPPSLFHLFYVFLEVLKVTGLILFINKTLIKLNWKK